LVFAGSAPIRLWLPPVATTGLHRGSIGRSGSRALPPYALAVEVGDLAERALQRRANACRQRPVDMSVELCAHLLGDGLELVCALGKGDQGCAGVCWVGVPLDHLGALERTRHRCHCLLAQPGAPGELTLA